MLRNDGKIFECEFAHPYILYNVNDLFRVNIYDLIVSYPETLKWFYSHTNQIWVKDKILECLQYLSDAFSNESVVDFQYGFGINYEDLIPLTQLYKIKPKKLNFKIDKNYIATCQALFEDLNDKCNQEFLRFRTSSMFYGGSSNGIYFRISSYGFNWFNLIWEIVYKNQSWISDVTIVADSQSGKKEPTLFYNLNGPVNQMSTEKFIWLKGNPIVENHNHLIDYDILNNGGSLLEVFGDYGPFHNHRKFKSELNKYVKENFTDR